jgi:hypothetical protein
MKKLILFVLFLTSCSKLIVPDKDFTVRKCELYYLKEGNQVYKYTLVYENLSGEPISIQMASENLYSVGEILNIEIQQSEL